MDPLALTHALQDPVADAPYALPSPKNEISVQPYSSVNVPKRHTPISAQAENISWGRRYYHGSHARALGSASLMLLSPLVVIMYSISLSYFGGSLGDAGQAMQEMGFFTFFRNYSPRPTTKASLYYMGWLILQAALFQLLHGKINTGQLTPAGNLLRYRTNGFSAWFYSHVAWAYGIWLFNFDAAWIAKNFGPLLLAANAYGCFLTAVAYFKAIWRPTHPRDCKFSGSWLYDVYMGVELNPRLGVYFDLKLFHNSRPGIIAWTLIDLSFIAYQHQLHGRITSSILIVSAFQLIYVVDFFVNEAWYLRTIDICHDHFGFYLAWGSMVWLPAMYTLQVQYLAIHPVELSRSAGIATLIAGISGYLLFRSVNHQKDLARRTKGACLIWGQPAKIVKVSYRTRDGESHESMLLVSGWWGMARHVNYLGDLILAYAMCATCGFEHVLPWTYAAFMTTLLVHRCWRDEERCEGKYGEGWERYQKTVKWVLVPGVY